MNDVVIRAEGLGKKYLIGHETGHDRYVALRDVMTNQAKGLVRSAVNVFRGHPMVKGDDVEEFWALKNVSFEIKRGDVVGIIGRNGAGKSTLLKVLSRITEPSEGRVTIEGRIASLLEVGTGFHPELSGRENIYLNGAVLGMTRVDIKRKFDEIVDFAGIERFLDTPVKRYSSGMYVRLAFSVAAHLEPEILVVDEVLAVGDAEFQKKCLGKMQDVAGHGRTVLFVSHNMSMISRLCQSGLLLSDGQIAWYPDIDSTIKEYLSQSSPTRDWHAPSQSIVEGFSPHRFWQEGRLLRLSGSIHNADHNLVIAVRLSNQADEDVFWTTNRDATDKIHSDGKYDFKIELPNILAPGEYSAEVVSYYHEDRYLIKPGEGPRIAVVMPNYHQGGTLFSVERPGILKPLIRWT